MARLLLVEDESNVALALKNELEREGHAVSVAGNGETAFSSALSGKFDLILLDIGLPKKDGYAVCSDLRRGGNQTPIMMLTAKDSEADRVRGLSLGADDYVVKPFDRPDLLARIAALLRRTTSDGRESFKFGNIQVNLANGEVRRDSRPIDLTPLEFKLLTTFIRNSGRILTRDQLLDDVWRPESNPTYQVVDDHVMNLRRKMEIDAQQPRYIVSVRSFGYRFEV